MTGYSERNKFEKQLHENRNQYPDVIKWRVVEGFTPETAETYIVDGSTFAIDGEIIYSVCRNKNSKITGQEIIKMAVQNGGKYLYAFGKHLYEFYTKNGFQPKAWMEFDKRKAPIGWTKEEPLIFYSFNGIINRNEEMEIFINKKRPSLTFEEAMIEMRKE